MQRSVCGGSEREAARPNCTQPVEGSYSRPSGPANGSHWTSPQMVTTTLWLLPPPPPSAPSSPPCPLSPQPTLPMFFLLLPTETLHNRHDPDGIGLYLYLQALNWWYPPHPFAPTIILTFPGFYCCLLFEHCIGFNSSSFKGVPPVFMQAFTYDDN